jgi:hypothetical protein
MPDEHRVYLIRDANGNTWRIRARDFSTSQHQIPDGFCALFFADGKSCDAAKLVVEIPYQVIPEDMLFSQLKDDLIFPVIPDDGGEKVDPFTEGLFSDAEKKPFTPEERRLLHQLLERAKQEIHERFETSESQQADIDEKLDYLKRKVDELDKFNWKRLFLSTLIGIAVDLGFGTLVPKALLGLFKEVLSYLAGRLLGKK